MFVERRDVRLGTKYEEWNRQKLVEHLQHVPSNWRSRTEASRPRQIVDGTVEGWRSLRDRSQGTVDLSPRPVSAASFSSDLGC